MRQAFVIPFSLLALGAMSAHGADDARLTIATERVVVFKDGYALFLKAAHGIADGDGTVFTDEVPDGAVLGTFWATAADGGAVPMTAQWAETRERRERTTACVTTLELLRANVGKAVTLGLASAPTALSGTVVEVLDLPATEPAETAGSRSAVWAQASSFQGESSVPGRVDGAVRELVPQGGALVVIDTDGGRMVLPTSDVRTISGPALTTTIARQEEVFTRVKRLAFPLGAQAAGDRVDLRLLYFSEGVRWIPTYRVSGELVDQATIALQGELLNEAEDIVAAPIDLVVGVPNFRFRTTVSPLALEATLRSALAAAVPSLMNSQYASGSFANRAGERQDGEADVADLAPDLAAERQQDLFVHSVPPTTLRKGMRATVPLWQMTAPLSHLYTLDIAIVRDAQSGARAPERDPADPRSPLRFAEHRVWHQFELTNVGQAPWTTGAALILRGNVPLGQELLTYTPIRGSSLLPVTVAVDMCGDFTETETERVPSALEWAGYPYAMVRKTATVTVSNLRAERSRTRVGVALGGRASAPSDGGTVRLTDFRADDWNDNGYRAPNNHSEVRWELDLAPGEVRTLTFTCETYVR
ncbi:MAG TPA: hypothetical protein VEL07_02110 [Planctomycetota bacterium]|nr:hypothetical protein [Planctomycetota bacterium]